MARKPKTPAPELEPEVEELEELEPEQAPRSKVGQSPPADHPSRKAHAGEISAYEAAVRSLDDFIIAMEGIEPRRRDPELVVIYNSWINETRAAVMARLGRLQQKED